MKRNDHTPFERRGFLRLAGALGIGSLFARSLGAAPAPPRGPVWQVGSCTLTPSAIAGPFYVNSALMRKDITEGKPGVHLDLFLKVVQQSDCMPIQGAVVDLWHADALGRYSGFPSQGTAGLTFLRGIQVTPASGVVGFRTIFPGWYPGRTTHLHLKINPNQSSELTTQLYFPNGIARTVESLPPYDLRGPNPTSNGEDAYFLPETVLPTFELARAGILPPFVRPRRLVAGLTIVIA